MTIYTDTASSFNFAYNKDYLLKIYSNKQILQNVIYATIIKEIEIC